MFETYQIDWVAQEELQAIATANPADPPDRATVQLIGSASTGSPTSYSWEWVGGPEKVVPYYNWHADTRVTLDRPGIYHYRLTVSDGQSSDSATVQINLGHIPTASAGVNQFGLSIGTEVQLSGSGFDPLGRTLHYRWTQTSGRGAQISDPTAPNPTFLLEEADTYEFKLVVWIEQDGLEVASAPSYVTISTGGSGTVSGIVYQDQDQDGSYTAGVDLTVVGALVQGGGGSAYSDADGSYQLSVPAGTHTLSAQKSGVGTGYRAGIAVLPGDNLTNVHIGLGTENCQYPEGIKVCADNLDEYEPGIWTGSSNIRIGSHVWIEGSVTANVNSGQESISGNGEVSFDLGNGQRLPIYSGDYTINVYDALVNMGSGAVRELGDILGFRITGTGPNGEPDINININGSFTLSNAEIELQKPSPASLILVEFTIDSQGNFGGSVESFTTQIGDMDLLVTNAQFNNEGLLLDGTLSLPDSLSGGTTTINVDDLGLTRDGVQFKSIQLQNYTLSVGGMTASIENAILTTDGIQASGDLTIPADITPNPVEFDDIIITHNGIEGGTVHLERLADVTVGPATLNMYDATLEMFNDGTGTKAVVSIARADMVLHEDMGGGHATVEDLVISNEGITFREGFVALPTIKVSHFTLQDTWVRIEQLAGENGYSFQGKGTLIIQQLAPGSSNTNITAGVLVYITDTGLEFKEAELGISGPRIPLGSTGAFLTGLYGKVDFMGAGTQFDITVDLEAGPRVGDLVAISGQVGTTINLSGWMSLQGNMKLFSYEITQVELSVNKPGVSDRGVRGTLHIDVFAILIGDATVYVYMDDGDRPAIEGSADVLVQLPLEKVPAWMRPFFGDVETIELARATATLGKFDGVYGISTNTRYGDLFDVTVFADTEGKIEIGIDWDNPFWVASPHVVNAERHLALPAGNADRFAPGIQNDASLVTLEPNTESAAFYLDATGESHLTFSLLTPTEEPINAGNVDQFPDVTLARRGEEWTYLVAIPAAGDWYMVVDGILGGEVYQTEAFVKNSAPAVTITGIPGAGTLGEGAVLQSGYEISWAASDPEEAATLSLFYDIDNSGFDGVLIEMGLPLTQTSYVWAPDELASGSYYIYAKVEDNANAPTYDYFDIPIQIVNTTPPTTPAGLSVQAGVTTTVLTWTHNVEVDLAGYRVRYTSEPGPLTHALTTTLNSIVIPRAERWKPLTMTVAAFDTSGNESAEAVPVVLPAQRVDDVTPPEPPASITPTLAGMAVQISWQAAVAENDLGGYRVYYDTRHDAPYLGTAALEGPSPIDLGDVTDLTLHGLPPGRALFATVTALDVDRNESLPSNEVRIRVTDGVDSDGDGLPDDFELAHWDSVDEIDGTDDSDHDGLPEMTECLSFTLPLDPDTDGDGTEDGAEVASGTDPLCPGDRPDLRITTRSIPTTTEGASYFAQLEAISGTLPYTWTVVHGRLPAGVAMDIIGLVAGTPLESGRFAFWVEVRDAAGDRDRQRLTLDVYERPGDRPPDSVLVAGPTVGVTGTLYVFTASVAPLNVTLPITYEWRATDQVPVTHPATSLADVMSFTWNVTGDYSVWVTATNALGMVTSSHTISVGARTLCDDVTEIPYGECSALVALYHATGGDGWTDNTGWLSTTTPCTWKGVTCSDNHVAQIDLRRNGLAGTLPPEMADLDALQTLSLVQNQIGGTIPPELGTLSHLTVLYLADNEFVGPIPPALGNLESLTSLHLEMNQLTGTIPLELGNLANLQYLALNENRLSGALPAELGNLANLSQLLIDDNALTGDIPPSFTNLTNLVTSISQTDFGYNGLTASDPALVAFLNVKDPDWANTQTIPPTNVEATSVSETSIDLAWTPITYTADAGFYEVSYATAAGGPYTVHGTTVDKTAAGHVLDGLAPGTTYYLVARTHTPAHGDQQNDLWSEYTHEISATTSIEPITGLVAINNSPTQLGGTTTLTASVTAGSNVSYTWALGDETTAVGAVASYIYPTAGSYTAIVTANNDVSLITATTVVMIQAPCHALTVTHTGQGADPVAAPASSAGCLTGQYVTGEQIGLSGAAPDPGWRIGGWTGTDDDPSIAPTNTVTMPAGDHTALVNYVPVPWSTPIWPMYQYDVRRTNRAPFTGPSSPELKWMSPNPVGSNSTPAIGADGTLYVGSNDYHLYAVNPDGSVQWTYTTPNVIWSSPTVYTDGTIYVGHNGYSDGSLLALNPNGSLKWSYPAREVRSSPAIGSDGTIYVGASDARLYAINPDGTLKWAYQTGFNESYASPAVGADGTIYTTGAKEGSLHAVNPDGTNKWTYPIGGDTVSSPTVDGNGTIYVGGADNNLYAVNPDGTLKWSTAVGDVHSMTTSAAIGPDGTIYIVSGDGILHALDPATGASLWTYATNGGNIFTTPTVDANGIIYLAGGDGTVHALHPDGSVRWKLEDTGLRSSLVLDGNGYLYGQGSNGLGAIGETGSITGVTAENDSPTQLGNPTTLTATVTAVRDWQHDVVDGDGHEYWSPVLALDPAGLPHIAYQDLTTGHTVQYASFDGTQWLTETIDARTVNGYTLNLAIGADGKPQAAWRYSGSDRSVIYGYRDGTGWHYETVHADCWPKSISLALDSADRPHLSYWTDVGSNIMHAWDDGTAWQFEVVKTTAHYGVATAIEIDSADQPHIAYAYDGDDTLNYAWYDGTWHFQTIGSFSAGDAAGTIALALDATDRPHILYYDQIAGQLEYMVYDGSAWQREVVGPAGALGSLGVDRDDRSHISYVYDDGTGPSTFYAYRESGSWHSESPAEGNGARLALDANDQPSIAYVKTTGELVYAISAWPSSNPDISWSFGDGEMGSGSVVTHTYPTVGIYTAVVTASNPISVVTATTTVTITDIPITELGAINDSPTQLGDTTALTASITSGSNVSYSWALGDGATANGALVTRVYPVPGSYTAIVTASNNVSLITATTVVTIQAPCYALTTTHTGQGTDPTAVPVASAGCATGQYMAGEQIALSDAVADRGWSIGGWTGTADDNSISPTNTVTMPAADHAVMVNYVEEISSSWHLELAYDAGYEILQTSLALDGDGRPHIAFRDEAGQDLEYTTYDGTGWQIETVHSSDNTGGTPSLAIDPGGRPHVSWVYHEPSHSVMYGKDDGTAWQIDTVSGGSWPKWTSLALDSAGAPHISYFTDLDSGTTANALMHAWNDGAWHLERIDGPSLDGMFTSLALDSQGHPHIAYSHVSGKALKYAWYDGTWHIETVYSDGQIFGEVALALDASNLPHIAHIDRSRNTIEYFWNDESSWLSETVSSAVGGYGAISLRLDSLNQPHVTYPDLDGTDAQVQYAYRDAGTWHVETVVLGRGPSLALDAANIPHISYYDSVPGQLVYASRTLASLYPVGFAPPANSHTVPLTSVVSITYNRSVDAASVTTTTLAVHAMQTGLLTETYTVQGGTIQLTPANPFRPGEWIQASATTSARSMGGHIPASPTAWQFQAAVAGGSGVFVDSGHDLVSPVSPESYALELGDLDGDGDLDAVIGSCSAGEVWVNNGTGVFTNTSQSLSHLAFDLALGDLDGDGDLDVFLARVASQPNQVWLNDGHGVLTNSGQNLGSRSSRAIALGDVDGDGDLDAFVGNTDSSPNEVWLNDGTGEFIDSGQALGASSTRGVALGDLDGDGDLDAYEGNDGGQPDRVWRNDGTGYFVDTGQLLGTSSTLDVALGDFDDDGDLDVLTGNSGPCKTWLNDGHGNMSASQSLNTDGPSVDVGDVDADGDLDLFLGRLSADRIWLNDGAAAFTDSSQLLGADDSEAAAFGDLDGDGDLDILVGIGGWDGGPNKVWFNKPADLQIEAIVPRANSHTATLTTSISITYSHPINATTVHTRTFGVHGMSTGLLTRTYSVEGSVVRLSPALPFKPGELVHVSATTATVSVDGRRLALPTVWQFRTEVDRGSTVFVDSGQQLESLSNPSSYAVALGDLNGDTYLDAFVGSNGAAEVWLNDGMGIFTNTFQSFPHLCFAIALGDLDGDGDLDAFLGRISEQPNQVWLNTGNGTFIDTGQRLGTMSTRALALGDLDGDGDLDAYVGSYDELPDQIWLNNGRGEFSDTGQRLGATSSRYAALGDLDGDGDLDAFVANTGAPDCVWLNDGHGHFATTGQALGDDWSLTVALGDVDSDTDLDAIVGTSSSAKIWLNDGTGIFSLGDAVYCGTYVAVGDLDGDGDLDAFGVSQFANRVCLNDGLGDFTDTGQRLGNVRSECVALGDLDADGDLDAFVGNAAPNRVWHNCNGLCVASVTGPVEGLPDFGYSFTVSAAPVDSAQPVTYTWHATSQSPVTHVSGMTDTVTFAWDAPGVEVITVTASHAGNIVTATHTITISPPPTHGLIYEYYEGDWSVLPDFDALPPTLQGAIPNFSLSPRLQDDDFAFRFTGCISIATTGVYTFYTSSDDGSRLYIDDTMVVDNDGLHSLRERAGSIHLTAGCQPIAVTYFEAGGSQELVVQYEGAGLAKQPVPDAILFPTVPPDEVTFDVALARGWNLVSWPLIPSADTLTGTLASLGATCDAARTYNAGAAGDPWKDWPGELVQVDETMAVWLHVTEPATLTISGSHPTSTTIPLHAGWNLVGYPSHVAMPVTQALTSIEGCYDVVQTFDPTRPDFPWQRYNVSLPSYVNDLKWMIPGLGYWIHATTECTWTVSY
ncbi:MAG: VCBS repeat-containing protein [Anaerolineae bacterium]|nr:VCBS repeat-containing protein [Anaerolineae bacterium]